MAQMILENRWYESESVSVEGFFKDLSLPSKKNEFYIFRKSIIVWKWTDSYLSGNPYGAIPRPVVKARKN